jgi:ATP-binding cassette subfamily B protein
VAVLAGAGRYGMRQILNGVSRKVELDLRDDFFARLMRLDAAFSRAPLHRRHHEPRHQRHRGGADGGGARVHVPRQHGGLLRHRRHAMAWIDVGMTLATLVPLLLLPPVTLWFGKVIHDRFQGIQEQQGVIATMAQENLAGQRIVKAYGQEAYQSRRFGELSLDYLQRNVDLARTSGLFYPSLGLLSGAAMVVALWLGGHAMVRGEVTNGELVLFLLYVGMLTFPMIALGWVVNLFQRGAASMGRVSRILGAVPEIADAGGAEAPAEIRGDIEFRNVTFRYPGTERDILRDVSFHVPAGSTVAIVGPTGSGKSTVVQLLVRLYDPTAGEVRVDGIAVSQWPLARLRAAVATVPQDTFLFSTTIEDNLALGFHEDDPERRAARVRAAAGVARLHQTVEELPAGYDTLLGERGINLSGGQKQRAALARAIARDARILVLDDALSAVDTHTEHEILGGLRGVLEGRTSVIVSHRVTAVMHADLILVLADGRIVEQGTHGELVRAGGVVRGPPAAPASGRGSGRRRSPCRRRRGGLDWRSTLAPSARHERSPALHTRRSGSGSTARSPRPRRLPHRGASARGKLRGGRHPARRWPRAPPTARPASRSWSGSPWSCATSTSPRASSSPTCRTSCAPRSRAIVTYGEILRDGLLGELAPRQAEAIESMIGACRQLLSMIEEILTYARTNAQAITLHTTEFPIDEVVRGVHGMNASLMDRKRLRFEIQMEPGLPAVRADRDKLIHVLGNLLGNAIKFTPEGGRVVVEARRDPERPDWVEIAVTDTGIGSTRSTTTDLPGVRAGGHLACRAHHGTGWGWPSRGSSCSCTGRHPRGERAGPREPLLLHPPQRRGRHGSGGGSRVSDTLHRCFLRGGGGGGGGGGVGGVGVVCEVGCVGFCIVGCGLVGLWGWGWWVFSGRVWGFWYWLWENGELGGMLLWCFEG